MEGSYPQLTKAYIEAAAEKLRRSSKFFVNNHQGAKTPIDEIAEFDLGLNIDFDNLRESFHFETSSSEDQILGAMVFSNRQIIVDETLDPVDNPAIEGRYRFTIAHEIGHWVLHRHLFSNELNAVAALRETTGDYLLRQKTPDARLEWQANYFAACILMPRIEVERAWYQFSNTLRPFDYETCRKHLNLPFLEDFWLPIGQSLAPNVNQSEILNADKNRIFKLIAIELATLLNVSTQSMQIRLKELGFLISPPKK
jgi:hypothetical protein